MNTIRMMAIALPMTLLLAYGGGGGGGGVAAVNPLTTFAEAEADNPTIQAVVEIAGEPNFITGMEAISYEDLTLADGAFEGSGNDQVEGRFYGTEHAEVGGFFNTETVTGAFGGTRQ